MPETPSTQCLHEIERRRVAGVTIWFDGAAETNRTSDLL